MFRLKLHKLQHGGSSDLVVKPPQLDNETTQRKLLILFIITPPL